MNEKFHEMKKENPSLTFGEFMRKGKTPTKTINIDGVGTITQYGEWNVEKLVARLLQEKSIVGE